MSTILEMAEIVRAGGFSSEKKIPLAKKVEPRVVNIYSEERIRDQCDLFDTTPWELCCAIECVGTDPRAIGRFLRNRDSTRHRSAVAID
jgi:hypothetical protein